jgi:exodeoxyribonuclease VII small subunit
MNRKQSETVHLETMLKDLENIVKNMESQQLDLEESLSLFEKGVGLIKHCRKVLIDAEQKVQLLSQVDHQDELVDFKPEE